MKVKDLRKALKGLPANMDVVVNTGIPNDDPAIVIDKKHLIYQEIVLSPRKAKKKLTKKVGAYTLVQSRPQKDDNATLSLVIE